MNFRRLLGVPETRSLSFQDVFGRDLWGASNTKAGPVVTTDSALKVSAVYGSVRILADGVATLPADAYRRIDGARRPYRPAPSWLHAPNPARKLDRIDYLTQVMVSLLLHGNAYVAVVRDGTGQIVELTPLDPSAMDPRVVDGRVVYVAPTVSQKVYGPEDILHVRGLMKPGEVKGLSPIAYARETIGVALAAQEYGASFFGNGALPGAVIEVPGELSDVGTRQLKSAWNDVHKGSGNASKIGVLTEGAKFSAVSIPPEDAQFLQTRQFQVPDIARIFGVPPHLLQDASGSTSWGSGLNEQNIAYVQHSLRPWVERVESGHSWLLTTEGRPDVFVKLSVEGLMRGAYMERISTYGAALDRGIYTLNEVRAFEDLPPVEGGDVTRVPLNTGTAPTGPVTQDPRPPSPAPKKEAT